MEKNNNSKNEKVLKGENPIRWNARKIKLLKMNKALNKSKNISLKSGTIFLKPKKYRTLNKRGIYKIPFKKEKDVRRQYSKLLKNCQRLEYFYNDNRLTQETQYSIKTAQKRQEIPTRQQRKEPKNATYYKNQVEKLSTPSLKKSQLKKLSKKGYNINKSFR